MFTRTLARRDHRRNRVVSLVAAPTGLTVTGSTFGDDEPVETARVLAIGLTARGRTVALVAYPGALDLGTSFLAEAGALFDTYEISP